MDISSITSASSANFVDPAIPTRVTGKKTLDVDDFLKLLTVQFTSQDPMKPMEDTQFISQMTTFTSLEQMQTLSRDFAAFSKTQGISAASTYLGKQVTVTDASTPSGTASGVVSGVSADSGDGPRLTVSGKSYPLTAVQSVALAPSISAHENQTSVLSTAPNPQIN